MRKIMAVLVMSLSGCSFLEWATSDPDLTDDQPAPAIEAFDNAWQSFLQGLLTAGPALAGGGAGLVFVSSILNRWRKEKDVQRKLEDNSGNVPGGPVSVPGPGSSRP